MNFKTSELESEISKSEKYRNLYFHYGQKELKEKIQPALLQVLTDFDLICQSAGIFYVIAAGTLLGAVREKGFISWDDDVDVLVKSDDIDKIEDAIKLCGLDDKYEYIAPWQSPEVTVDGKFMCKNVTWGSLLDDETIDYRLYIDVLPIENAPNNFIFYKLKSLFSTALLLSYNSMRVTRKNDELLDIISHDSLDLRLNLFIRRLVALPSVMLGKKRSYKLLKKISSYKNSNTKRVTIPFGVLRYKGETLQRSVFDGSVPIIFEGRTFQAPIKYLEYLSNRYGDYMTPTKEQERFIKCFKRRGNWKELLNS